MKKYLALFLAMIMALSLVACGAKEEPAPEKEETPKAEDSVTSEETEKTEKKYTVGMIPYYLRDDFYKDLVIAAQNRAAELGVELLIQDPNGDASKAMEILENYQSMGVDAICCNPVAKDAMIPKLREVIDSGIPIVTFDGAVKDPEGKAPNIALQFDFNNCGVQLGKLVEEYVTKTGFWDGETKLRTAIIYLPTSVVVGVPLIEAAENYLVEQGIIEVVAKQDGKADRNHSMSTMENILTAENGDIQLILGFNYDACMGAVEACEAYGLTDKDVVAFSQLWGTEAFEQLETGGSIWKGGVAYSPTAYGAEAVQACYDLLEGVERDKEMWLEPTMLDSEKIADFDWESIIAQREALN